MTGAGIRLGTSQLNSFARQGVPQSLIVLTDGVSHDDTAVAAAQAFNQGIQIFAVGIGSGINRAELMNIAAQNPAKVHRWTPMQHWMGFLTKSARSCVLSYNSTTS